MYAAKHLLTAAALTLALALPGCNGAGSSTIGRSAVSVAKESRAEGGRQYTLGPQFESQLEQMISREVAALGGKEGVPMELNRQVLLNINYFLNNGRGFMTTGLSRGSKYLPMMKAIFRQKGLPEDLVYLALIESGFKNDAVSHASAVGPWQFIASTGRRYGLTINDWVDERRDPVKATYAAADYLTTLHDMFNSWPLAIAAYNSGEGKIIKGMKDYGVSNFWDMSSAGDHLADETKLYVPSFLAVTFIAKDPAAYGLNIETQPPDQWDEIVIPAPLELKEAAKFSGSTVERLKELNPHLKKEATPPGERDFVLRIPAGSAQRFAKAYGRSGTGGTAYASAGPSGAPASSSGRSGRTAAASADGGPRLSSITHKVQDGDTLGSIAKLYGVPVEAIRKNNRLDSNLIRKGQILTIQSDLPLTARRETGGPVMVVESPRAARGAAVHTVAAGDTLSSIALKYGMSVKELADTNGIKGVNIQVGQKLTVAGKAEAPKAPAKAASAGSGVHVVAAGESLGVIAEKYGLKTKELMDLNGLSDHKIRIGQKLKVAGSAARPSGGSGPKEASSGAAAKAASAGSGVHVVAAGESLGVIAEKYGLKTKELMDLNGLSDHKIRIGQKLKVAGSAARPSGGGTVETSAASSTEASSGGSRPPAEASEPRTALQGRLPGRPETYQVAGGDTLYSIARNHNLSVDQLKALNNLTNNDLRAGQILKLR